MYRYFDEAPAKDPISQMLYVDTKTYMVADILTKVDRMSMATSLEVRVPLLDHLFVEWATGLPVEWKLRGGQQKYILRKLAERVGVPREAIYRPKQGFAMPLVHWIRNELKDLIMTVLLEPRTLQRGYFNPESVRRLLDEHFRGRRDHSARDLAPADLRIVAPQLSGKNPDVGMGRRAVPMSPARPGTWHEFG